MDALQNNHEYITRGPWRQSLTAFRIWPPSQCRQRDDQPLGCMLVGSTYDNPIIHTVRLKVNFARIKAWSEKKKKGPQKPSKLLNPIPLRKSTMGKWSRGIRPMRCKLLIFRKAQERLTRQSCAFGPRIER